MSDQGGNKTTVPGTPIGLEEMASVCANIGVDMEQRQAALVAAGLRGLPDEREMRRAEVLAATARFLDRLAPHMHEIAPILRKQPHPSRMKSIVTGEPLK